MRTSILAWSTASGLILGLFIDAALMGAALLFSAAAPNALVRPFGRWSVTVAIVVLAAIPLILAVLGYLEGQLKVT